MHDEQRFKIVLALIIFLGSFFTFIALKLLGG